MPCLAGTYIANGSDRPAFVDLACSDIAARMKDVETGSKPTN